MKTKKCPKCSSKKTKMVDYMGIKLILCENCGYDERDEYQIYPEEKLSQKAKARYSIYKTGGKGRTRKKSN